jgi:hypothetical protein
MMVSSCTRASSISALLHELVVVPQEAQASVKLSEGRSEEIAPFQTYEMGRPLCKRSLSERLNAYCASFIKVFFFCRGARGANWRVIAWPRRETSFPKDQRPNILHATMPGSSRPL